MPQVETPQVETPQVETNAETHEEPKIGIRVDERTGRRIIESVQEPFTNEEPKQEEPKQEEPQPEQQEEPVQDSKTVQDSQPVQTTQQTQPVQTQPIQTQQVQNHPLPFYSPAEMTLAIQMGQVDQNRIPPEYAAQYAAMVSRNAPKPKSEAELRNDFLDSVNKMAKERTMKDLGVTDEELSTGEFSDDENIRNKVERYKTQLEINRTNIISEYAEQVRIEQLKAQQANEFKASVASWINEQRAQEPHFDDIGFFMQEHYKTMPYEKAASIAPAMQKALSGNLDPQSAQVIQNYYNDCRKEYYAKLNGTSTTPTPRSPTVERRGTGKSVEKPVDYAEKLRNASVRDKAAIVGEWLNAMKG
jgi:hypothetical protein